MRRALAALAALLATAAVLAAAWVGWHQAGLPWSLAALSSFCL